MATINPARNGQIVTGNDTFVFTTIPGRLYSLGVHYAAGTGTFTPSWRTVSGAYSTYTKDGADVAIAASSTDRSFDFRALGTELRVVVSSASTLSAELSFVQVQHGWS